MSSTAVPESGAGPDSGPEMASVHRLIEGRVEMQAAVRQALERVAAASSARQLFLCDAGFADWPLGDRSVVALFEAWARSHRSLVMIASSFDDLARRHPRWVTWRRQWSHIVDCRVLADREPAFCPGLLHAPGVCTLRLFDVQRHRGAYTEGDRVVDRAIGAEFDVLTQQSEPGFPVTTLGL